MVWLGMVCYGLIRYGMVWFDTLKYGLCLQITDSRGCDNYFISSFNGILKGLEQGNLNHNI